MSNPFDSTAVVIPLKRYIIGSEPYLKGNKLHEIVQFHLTFDGIFDGIMEVSKKQDCDFIVMGSQGATGLKEMFIGSNTEKVIRNLKSPSW